MRRFIRCGGALLLVAALGASGARAAEPGAVLEYEVRYGPLQVMALRTTARLDPDGYQASTEVRTVGVVALLEKPAWPGRRHSRSRSPHVQTEPTTIFGLT